MLVEPFFKFGMWVKKNPKISLLLLSFAAVLNGTGSLRGLVNEDCNDAHMARLLPDAEESSFYSEYEISTKGAEKPRTNVSRNPYLFINLPLSCVGKCLVRLDCLAGTDAKNQAKDFAHLETFVLQGVCGPGEPKAKRGTDGMGRTSLREKTATGFENRKDRTDFKPYFSEPFNS